MKVSPMLYSTPMAKGLWEDRKKQTRRVLTPQPAGVDVRFNGISDDNRACFTICNESGANSTQFVKLKHATGDVLYVRETWCHIPDSHDGMGDCTYYRALPPEVYKPPYRKSAPEHWNAQNAQWMKENGFKWKPSIHMPRWASRMTLLITDVRVQRLQDISEEDAKAEGTGACCLKCTEAAPCGCVYPQPDYKDGFALLWDSLNEDRGFGWDVNPWVTAYTFDVIKQNVDEYLEELEA
ncbi:MAG: hypothetical protein JJ939_11490 [Alphaproteobacteria bacterium]|nr:hypothetical protein [Alphaproteobacteria bacterium]MBO6629038.1 hypothetical protein [Alphaproteobacteria bacterium]